jgi:acetyl-CoA/propionyl-CoA carboxylase biotin carboxyl carrier protein
VLVANRGEIACRVLRTLRELGIRSVAVYEDPDRAARHVALADEAVLLPRTGHGDGTGYLDVGAVVAAALATGAQGVHPGYGFLAENADLARACDDAGIVLVGPGTHALEVMGDKIRAKAHVARHGVPVLPGVAEPGLSDAELTTAARDVGFPLLVKPSAGGGGAGMQVVEHPDDLAYALATARRVARGAFGDDTLLLERYLPAPRHIEVQVLADRHGTVVHLGERECSLQRRHQKIVEEAPSPLVDDAMRARLGSAACAVARSIGYVGAGTVEMLVPADSPGEHYFIEMNTRLQVEHPVTELVTGLDLVAWQLRVAAGEHLTFTQDDVHLDGHAVEARVYAESPARGFLPTTGRVLVLDEAHGPGVRVDSGLTTGTVVGPWYDPLLAKVVAWGTDRTQALARLDDALAATTLLGVETNVEHLRALLADPDVRAGRLDTGLVERALPRMPARTPDVAVLAAAVLWAEASHASDSGARTPADPGGPGSAWRPDGWRLGVHAPRRRSVQPRGSDPVDLTVSGPPDHATVTLGGGEPTPVRLLTLGTGTSTSTSTASVEVDGRTRTLRLAVDDDVVWVGDHGATFALTLRRHLDRLDEQLTRAAPGVVPHDPEVRSPMPGTVVTVAVTTGEHVSAGQTLLTVEAMKMEHRLTATTDGVVTLTARPADQVRLDQVVATITPHPHEGTVP